MPTVVVIGGGYVGLVSAACFAQKNNSVVLVENDSQKLEALRAGRAAFYEPGLDDLVAANIQSGRLQFTAHIAEALLQHPEFIFICVGTPPLPDGSVDMSAVTLVAQEIGRNLDGYCVVVNKSTVPVGTTQLVRGHIVAQLAARRLDVDFDVVSNPEFLKEGTALADSLAPDRVVVGTSSERAEKMLFDLYEPFLEKKEQFLVMTPRSAELTKYASNSMLATRISFMNQLALLADTVGADIGQVRRGMSFDTRIGSQFLNAGVGYGGSCFPKDVKALVFMGKERGNRLSLLEAVDTINNDQRTIFAQRIVDHYGGSLDGKTVAIWGLSFKPDTDDIRFAPSLDVITALKDAGASIVAYDPVATENVREVFSDEITYARSAAEALKGAHALVIMTEWKEFFVDPSVFKTLADATVFDGRNCFDPYALAAAGISYHCIGRDGLLQSSVVEGNAVEQPLKKSF